MKMAGLCSLPAESLVRVFASSPSISNASVLSVANKRLYTIWEEHGERIIAAILERHIPEIEGAALLSSKKPLVPLMYPQRKPYKQKSFQLADTFGVSFKTSDLPTWQQVRGRLGLLDRKLTTIDRN